MKRLIIGVLVLVLLVAGISCGADQHLTSGSKNTTIDMVEPAPPMAAPGLVSSSEGSRGAAYDYDDESPGDERVIVRTADMRLVVEDVVETSDAIAQVATDFDGFVVSSQVSGEDEDRRGWISIRVVDEMLDQAMDEIEAMAVRVKSKSTSSQDVTEDYIDLQSRLDNARATEEQYLDLLDEATDVDDILRIYQSLSQVRQEIEQIEGRVQYLERTSSMSLISVYLEPEVTAKPLVKVGWNALEVLKSAVRGLVNFGQVLGNIAIWLLIFSPIWGTVTGIIIWRLRKKRSQAR